MIPSRKIITAIMMYHRRADNFNNLKEYTKDLSTLLTSDLILILV